jgi:serine/threonine protein kinase
LPQGVAFGIISIFSFLYQQKKMSKLNPRPATSRPGLQEIKDWWLGKGEGVDPRTQERNKQWALPLQQTSKNWAEEWYDQLLFGSRFSKKFTVVKLLGEPGAFGAAFKCIDNTTDIPYAIKVVPMNRSDSQFYKEMSREIAILQCLKERQHINIVNLAKPAFLNDGAKCLMLQYTMLEDSRDLWSCWDFFRTPEKARPIVAQLLAGFRFLHEHRIVHRDFKPANMLIVGNNLDAPDSLRAVIIDFGKARQLPAGQTTIPRGRSDTEDELPNIATMSISIATEQGPRLMRQATSTSSTSASISSSSSSSSSSSNTTTPNTPPTPKR